MPSPSSPRRRLTILTTAALTLFVIDLAVRRAAPALRTYTITDFMIKPNVLARSSTPDVLFMGSSRAKYALVPEEFIASTGRTTFNLGIAGSKPPEWQLLARRLFTDDGVPAGQCATGFQPMSPRPDLIILGVNASEFRADTLPTHAALFTATEFLESCQLEGPSFEVTADCIAPRVTPAWALFDKHREIKLAFQESLSPLFPKHAQTARDVRNRVARPCPPLGYEHPWQMGRELRTIEERILTNAAAIQASSIPLFDPNAATFRRMEDLLKLLRRHHIQVLVAYLPNSPRTEARWQHIEPQMIEAIAAGCTRCGVPFLPCPQSAIPRTNADYMEETHVGFPLAQKITHRIAQQSIALGLVKPDTARLAQSPATDCPD